MIWSHAPQSPLPSHTILHTCFLSMLFLLTSSYFTTIQSGSISTDMVYASYTDCKLEKNRCKTLSLPMRSDTIWPRILSSSMHMKHFVRHCTASCTWSNQILLNTPLTMSPWFIELASNSLIPESVISCFFLMSSSWWHEVFSCSKQWFLLWYSEMIPLLKWLHGQTIFPLHTIQTQRPLWEAIDYYTQFSPRWTVLFHLCQKKRWLISFSAYSFSTETINHLPT